jgi:hypothetical protein
MTNRANLANQSGPRRCSRHRLQVALGTHAQRQHRRDRESDRFGSKNKSAASVNAGSFTLRGFAERFKQHKKIEEISHGQTQKSRHIDGIDF